jgi:hypothetical protein
MVSELLEEEKKGKGGRESVCVCVCVRKREREKKQWFICLNSPAPSGPPTNFNATVIDSRSILLSWEPPVADQRNGILRHYFISLVSDAGTETRNITSSQQSLTITGLRPYTEYSCTVRAGTIRTGPPTAALLRTTFEDGMLHTVSLYLQYTHSLY